MAASEAANYDKTAGWIVIGGVAAIALGSLLPWAEASAGIFSESKNGMEGDGVFTLIIAAVVAILAAPMVRRLLPTARIAFGVAFAAIAAAICVYDIADIQRVTGDTNEVKVSVGGRFTADDPCGRIASRGSGRTTSASRRGTGSAISRAITQVIRAIDARWSVRALSIARARLHAISARTSA